MAASEISGALVGVLRTEPFEQIERFNRLSGVIK
jgi:hypothetical protein